MKEYHSLLYLYRTAIFIKYVNSLEYQSYEGLGIVIILRIAGIGLTFYSFLFFFFSAIMGGLGVR